MKLRLLRHLPLSAASGLVCAHGRVYVIGDDQNHLTVIDDATAPGRRLLLFDGSLPADKAARKRRKPDCETLSMLPSGRALLALGSGSRANRCRAAWIALDARGEPLASPQVLDLTPLYAPLQKRFGELNIEGAFFSGREFVLLQRGHRGGAPNTSLHYCAGDVQAWLAGRGPPPAVQRMHEHRLPRVRGVPLTFTDGAALADGRWLFTAVAEATDNSVADGPCVGSAVGLMGANMGADARLQALWRVPHDDKVEGLALRERGTVVDLCLVTDADDPRVASRLLVGRVNVRQ